MLHSKQWHYSLHRDFQNCYSTRRNPTGFFSSNSSSNPTRVPIHKLPTENSPSRIQFYMQKAKSSSSTTTDISVFPDIPDIPDIPVIHDLSAFPGNSTSSSISRHSLNRMHILQFDWFPQKLHRVPVEQLQTFYKHYKEREML